MIVRDESGQVDLGWVEYLTQVLIVLSLIAYGIETEPDISKATRTFLKYFELFTIAAFTIEYLVRALLAKPRMGYLLSYFGMVDLLAVLPFYLTLGFDLRTVRAFRLLRLFRILKLARYSRAMRRIHRAFVISREELYLFGAVGLILLYLSAVGIYHFEHVVQPDVFRSLFDSLWWAVCTLTTVGYGDIYPITTGGKCFTLLVLMIGIGLIAVPTGLIASGFAKARAEEDHENEVRHD
jgi:voltage-gated potassium channel